MINAVVPWGRVPPLESGAPDEARNPGLCKPTDAVLMFKALVLSALYNLSDDQIEYQVRTAVLHAVPWVSVTMPDAKTVWLAWKHWRRRAWSSFRAVRRVPGTALYRSGWPDPDASIVPVPYNHNKREENVVIKAGADARGLKSKPAKRSQKDDVDVRWTKKHGIIVALRLQEPRQCGPKTQADPALSRRLMPCMKQPGGGSIADAQHRLRFGPIRLSLGRDRGNAQS
jgi:hypothetical protein